MKPYIIIIEYKDQSYKKIYYSNIDSKYRKRLKDKIDKKEIKLFCGCKYPDVKLELGIKENYQIYPLAKHYIHSDNCPKSQKCNENRIYNSAFKRMDDYNCVFANISLTFTKKRRDTERNENLFTLREPRIINAKMTIAALIKKLNMITFQDMAFSKNINIYPDIKDFCRWVSWKTKNIYIAEGKSLRDLSISNDNKKFFYGIYHSYEETSESYGQLTLYEYYSIKNKTTQEYDKKEYLLKMSWKKENFYSAFKEFENTYNGMTVESAIKKKYKIVCAGFYTQNKNNYNSILDVHFILVNDNGLFSESMYEANMYNHICNYLNNNDLKSKYAFYKPWEFGTSIYKNNYLEDGILYNKVTDEEIYIEVFGMNTPKYLETKKHKEELAGDRLITWNAAINEPLPDLTEKIEK